ncbi:prepilin-type N-terminal cleavage/methylation domain-containing protein [Candidatus Sumerlaeota bacterium]|nr:prepilin-type N-terminal cleavage/methylation domain-containing protein [Candidatus Sumerlaeota bacterium]
MKIMKHAFTLIELLIVVAIIAILAAIAVPNFLEAQTRAKVTRAKSDMRTIATGLESYFVDWNKYPYDGYNTGTAPPAPYNSVGYWYLNFTLTSPVSYLTTCDFQDQFRVQATTRQYQGLRYISTSSTWGMDFPTLTGRSSAASFLPGLQRQYGGWYLDSAGPDRTYGPHGWEGPGTTGPNAYYSSQVPLPYDSTNGTVSNGDIIRAQISPNYPN